MPSDNRYLVRRHHTWQLQVAVPRKLRQKLGKASITRSLGTDSITEARRRRDLAIPEIRRLFAQLADGPSGWDPELLAAELRAEIAAGQLTPVDARAALQEEIGHRALATPAMNQLAGPEGAAAERALASLDDNAQGLTLSKLIERHLEAIAQLSRSTRNNRRQALHALLAHVGDKPARQLTRVDIADWLTAAVASGKKLSTARLWRAQAVAACSWAVAAGLLERNPAEGTGKLLVGNDAHPPRRAFTDPELQTLFGVLDADLARVTRVLLYSGLRAGEALALHGRHTRDGLIVVEKSKTPSGRRTIPAHSQILDLIDAKADARLFGRWAAVGALGTAFRRACRAAELPPGLVLHSTRHSLAARLETSGCPQHVAEALLGHRRTGMSFGHYSKTPGLELMREAIERVSYPI
jgi:integrase